MQGELKLQRQLQYVAPVASRIIYPALAERGDTMATDWDALKDLQLLFYPGGLQRQHCLRLHPIFMGRSWPAVLCLGPTSQHHIAAANFHLCSQG